GSTFNFLGSHVPQPSAWHIQFKFTGLVSCADQKENAVLPRQPIDQPRPRAGCSVEHPQSITNGEAHDFHRGSHRMRYAIARKHTNYCPVQNILSDYVFWDCLDWCTTPGASVRPENWPGVNGRGQRTLI